MRYSYETTDKQYLDEQPELDSTIKDFVSDLEPSYQEGCLMTETPEQLECRSRDGFIPHSHNLGGYDKEYYTNLTSIWSSGCDLTTDLNTDLAAQQQNEAEKDFISDNKELFKDIPEDKRNYYDLNELGKSDLAESMDEYVMEWLDGCNIYFGYRFMYEGKSHGWHTLMIYVSANYNEYYGAHGRGSENVGEFQVKFRNQKELQEKLEKIKFDIESCL